MKKVIMLALPTLCGGLLLGLLLTAGNAGAQTAGTNTTSQNGYYFNSKTGNKTTVDGDIKTQEVQPAFDMNGVLSNFYSFDSLGVTIGADSSGWIDTHRYKTMRLFVYPNVSASTAIVRVAVQIQGSMTGTNDSSAVYTWARVQTRTSAKNLDSLGVKTTAVTAVGASTSAFDNEFTLFLPANAFTTVAGGWKGVVVPLEDWWAPYTRIRVRLLAFPAQVKLNVTFVGTPL